MYYDKIHIYPTFYLLKGDYKFRVQGWEALNVGSFLGNGCGTREGTKAESLGGYRGLGVIGCKG